MMTWICLRYCVSTPGSLKTALSEVGHVIFLFPDTLKSVFTSDTSPLTDNRKLIAFDAVSDFFLVWGLLFGGLLLYLFCFLLLCLGFWVFFPFGRLKSVVINSCTLQENFPL